MKDLHSGMTALVAIAAATLSDDNTPPTIDLQGYNAAEVVLAVGVGGITFTGANKVEFKLTHSDDDATYEAVTAADVLGVDAVADGGIVKALTAEHAAAAAYRFGYVGGKRYLKLLADFSGTHGTGTPIAAVVLAGEGHDNPQADQA
ncbi:hypothetical protein CEW88_15555 [Alloyangia pacifica]|uniref:Uncharacterized protein n=1 Tax=Alloyangia pacifica TaxID=311180 RepID=A0A2U8HH24_9RHOB|nr:hypothetical protein [Alloyangia pacifica]AWI85163.1 hypothetical protein CEW88_15555 [Alloyangia pacifica]